MTSRALAGSDRMKVVAESPFELVWGQPDNDVNVRSVYGKSRDLSVCCGYRSQHVGVTGEGSLWKTSRQSSSSQLV
ncbi:hypothetical protein BaRGS_00002317 [Batillaria attramentaria]|uniref:Uncharacterized protein n=1 Tax=Batillaria attramentaria TaxID=370345 RepID=A0ABD0M3Z3_9CAEN